MTVELSPRAIPHESRLLSLIASNIREMVVFVDVDGRMRWVNDAVGAQFGYARDELIGRHVYMLQAPGKNPPGIWGPGGTGELRERWAGLIVERRKDGSEFTARVDSFLVRDEGGRAVGLASISRDVSESVRAEEELREGRAFLREVIDLNPGLVFVKDLQGRYVLANKEFAEMHGISAEALVGKTDDDLGIPPEMAARYRRIDREVMETGTERTFARDPFAMPSGAARLYHTTKRPLRNAAGMITGLVGVCVDITAREEALRALMERNRELEIVVDAALAREFRIKELRDELKALRKRAGEAGDGA